MLYRAGSVGEGRELRLRVAARLAAKLVIALVVSLSVAPSSAAAAPGDLDGSFGGDGIVTTAFGSAGEDDGAYAMAIQADGKIVLAGDHQGDFAIARYNADGSLDASFDGDVAMPGFPGNGRVTTDIAVGIDRAHAVLVQPDGDIVAAGVEGTLASNSPLGGNFALVRYNADGTLDTGFAGDGKVTTEFILDSAAHAVALQGDGKIVAAGWASSFSQGDDFAVARYNADGTLDPSFDSDGMATTSYCPSDSCNDRAHAVRIQEDGKLILAGHAEPAAAGTFDSHFGLARYNADGTLDGSFSGDGLTTTPFSLGFPSVEAHALVIQPDGKLVAAGDDNGLFALVRYAVDGSLDPSFSGDGKRTIQVSPIDRTSVAYGLARQADGRLVAVGRASDAKGFDLHHDFAAARLLPDGSLDTSFSCDGKLSFPVAPSPQVDFARAAAIQSDGRIVLAGHADMGPPEFLDHDFAVARLLSSGDPPDCGGPGTAPPAAFSRTLTLAYSNRKKAFQGRLSSTRAACRRQTVTVFKKRPGRDRRVGADATNAAGRYRVAKRRKPGTYYASVPRKNVPAGACLPARSRKLKLS